MELRTDHESDAGQTVVSSSLHSHEPVTVKRRKSPFSGGPASPADVARRKLAVIEVAGALFTIRGFADTSLGLIAERSGVAVVTINKYFGDKSDVFRAVIDANAAWATSEPATIADDGTLLASLRLAARAACAATYRPQSIALARLIIAESVRFPELMACVVNTTLARFLGSFERLFVALEAKGLVSSGDHAQNAILFRDIILGLNGLLMFFESAAEGPDAEDIDERIAFFIRARFELVNNDIGKIGSGPAAGRNIDRPKMSANGLCPVITES
jgi:AcrR family transcriptional regulator